MFWDGNIYEEELNHELAQFSKLEAKRLSKHVKIGDPGEGRGSRTATFSEISAVVIFLVRPLGRY